MRHASSPGAETCESRGRNHAAEHRPPPHEARTSAPRRRATASARWLRTPSSRWSACPGSAGWPGPPLRCRASATGRANTTSSPTPSCRRPGLQLRGRARGGESLDKLLPEAFGLVCVATRRRAGHAAVRRAAGGRRRHAPGRPGRAGHRRRQDADRLAAGLPQRPGRQGRPRRHGQRLPGPPRRRVDGADLHGAGPDRRRLAAADGRAGPQARPTAATSPTAPPRSSASTSCATG